jgi:hypothetical protein
MDSFKPRKRAAEMFYPHEHGNVLNQTRQRTEFDEESGTGFFAGFAGIVQLYGRPVNDHIYRNHLLNSY